MHFQWYPGHMTKARRMMQENIKLIDIVVELVDARVPFSSKNPDIDELAKNKYRLIVLNKADMADAKTTAAWQNYFEAKGFFVAKVNSQKGAGMKEVKSLIEKACQEKKARDKKRGILNRPLRAMVVGIPIHRCLGGPLPRQQTNGTHPHRLSKCFNNKKMPSRYAIQY